MTCLFKQRIMCLVFVTKTHVFRTLAIRYYQYLKRDGMALLNATYGNLNCMKVAILNLNKKYGNIFDRLENELQFNQ